MALNDIIKAKKLVEHWKRSIWNMDQGEQSCAAYCLIKYDERCATPSCLQGIWFFFYYFYFWTSAFAKLGSHFQCRFLNTLGRDFIIFCKWRKEITGGLLKRDHCVIKSQSLAKQAPSRRLIWPQCFVSTSHWRLSGLFLCSQPC